jgi:hypothetical protein
MTSKLDDAAAAALAQVEYWDMVHEALTFVQHALANRYVQEEAVRDAASRLFGEIYKHKNDAWRNLFMWSTLTTGETRRQAKRLAMQRFLGENMNLTQYLNRQGRFDGAGWLHEDELKLRDEVRRLMKKEGLLDDDRE